jgi:N-acetylated-alpha-linked acidic dipeptidase
VLHQQLISGGLLNGARDPLAVLRAEDQGAEDQQIEGCAPTCSAFPRGRITSARLTTKTTPSGSLAKFKEWGLDATSKPSTCSSPRPKSARSNGGTNQHSPPSSPSPPCRRSHFRQHDEQLPTYNAYSIDGDVTAPLVYVNYGIPDDYEHARPPGVSVKGAIVIARYGGSWRGIKPKVAAEHGAIGCLIYSDPHEDGYSRARFFRKVPTAPRTACSAAASWTCRLSRRPAHSGVGATKDAKRLASPRRR